MGSADRSSCFILSKPILNGFAPDALNASDGNNGRSLTLPFQFVPSGSAYSDSLAEVSDSKKVRCVHIWMFREVTYTKYGSPKVSTHQGTKGEYGNIYVIA